MSVHIEISKHIHRHIEAQQKYKDFDQSRELAIEETLQKAKLGEEFDTVTINQITNEMNEIAKKYNFPLRKVVTKDMVEQYLRKNS